MPAKHHLQRLLLSRVGAAIDEEAKLEPGSLTRPEVALEGSHQHELQICERHVAEVSVADAVREHSLTNVIRRRLPEYARAGDVAATDIELVSRYMPMWNFRHFGLPDLMSGSATHGPSFRWVFPRWPFRRDWPSILEARPPSVAPRDLILADFLVCGSPTSAGPARGIIEAIPRPDR